MAFDPDKFLKETAPNLVKSSGQFDPNKFLSDTNEQPETLEQKYLEPNVYPVMGAAAKALDFASKPVQWASSLAVQPAVAMQRSLTGKAPEDFVNPITSPLESANKYGSTSALLKQIPSLNKPIAPNFTSEQFPKAASVISNVTGADIAALPSDIALTHGISGAMGLTGIPNMLEDYASKMRENTLLNRSSLPTDINQTMANNLTARKVGNTLKEYGLDNQLIFPDKLHESLTGSKVIGKDEFGIPTTDKVSSGVLGQVGTKLGELRQALSAKYPNISSNAIVENIVDSIIEKRGGKNAAVASMGQDGINKLRNSVAEIIKPEHGDKSFSDLIELKQNSYTDMLNKTPEEKQALYAKDPHAKEIRTELWKLIDTHQTEMGRLDPEAADLIKTNYDYSNLKTAQDMLKGGKLTSVAVPSLDQALLSLEIGKEIGMPRIGRAETAGFIKNLTNKLQPMRGAMAQGMADAMNNPLDNPIKIGLPASAASIKEQSSRLPQDQPMQVGRIPQSVNVPTPQQQLMMKKGFVENLADFEIPRSADEIIKNKQLVLAKIAQATNDPRAVAVLEDVLNKHPDKLGSALPALIANPAMTNLFKVNKYQSWVNGRILDPMEVQKAYKEVTDRKMSNTEKSILWDGLNRDGSFPESF